MLERDLAMIKVTADQTSRPHLMELIKVFRARVIDVAPQSLILEVSGTVDKIDGLLEVLRPFGVLEMVAVGTDCDDARWRFAAAAGAHRRQDASEVRGLGTRCFEVWGTYLRSVLGQDSAFASRVHTLQTIKLVTKGKQRKRSNGKSLLRQFRRPLAHSVEEGRDHRIRFAGARACLEPARQRRVRCA